MPTVPVPEPTPLPEPASLPEPVPFPEPTTPVGSRAEVFLGYLDYFRSVLVTKTSGLPESYLRGSQLPSGWTPIQLLKHLTQVERRWLEWGFEGRSSADIGDPWADQLDGRWYVAPEEPVSELVEQLHRQAARSRAVVERHDLTEVGQPGERWDGAEPATLERILFHLVQEYARHIGQLDIVRELADGLVGE